MHDHLPLRSSLRRRQGRDKPDKPGKPNKPIPPNPPEPLIPLPPPPPNSPSSTVTQASPSNPNVVASYSSQFSSQSNLDSNPTPTPMGSSCIESNSGESPSQVTTAFAVVLSTGTSVSHLSSFTAQKSDSATAYSSPTAVSIAGTASKVGVNIAIITGIILAIVFIVIVFRVMCVVLRRQDHGRTSSLVHNYPFAPQPQFQRIRTQSSVESYQTDMDTTSSPCVTISSLRGGS